MPRGLITLEFFTLRIIKAFGIWTSSLLWGGCPVRGVPFSGILGLYPPDASSFPPQIVTTKNVPQYCKMFPNGTT